MSTLLTASLLYRQSYRVLNRVVSTVLADFDLTPIEWAFLSTVYHRDGITVTELAHMLSVEAPMITQLSLQPKLNMLITLKRSDKDKRVKTMHLKSEGKKLLRKVENKLELTLEDFFKSVSPRDIKTHLKVLQYIADKE